MEDKLINLPSLDNNNYIKFCSQLQKREIYPLPNKEIVFGDCKFYSSIKHFGESPLSCGRFSILERNKRIECALDIKKDNDTLYVFFNGSRGSEPSVFAQLPRFGRWSWHSLFNGACLYIEDPMLYEYKDLNLGWYFGNKEESYLELVKEVIELILNNLNSKKLVFYGSSGGGYASIQMATLFPESLSISINPQVDLKSWGSYPEFKRITGIDLDEFNDPFKRNSVIENIKDSRSKFFVIQNILAHEDCQYHFFPLCNGLEHPVSYGLVNKNNLLTWLYSTTGGHNSSESKAILYFIMDIAEKFFLDNYFYISDSLNKQYVVISDLWSDSYIVETQKKINLVLVLINQT